MFLPFGCLALDLLRLRADDPFESWLLFRECRGDEGLLASFLSLVLLGGIRWLEASRFIFITSS